MYARTVVIAAAFVCAAAALTGAQERASAEEILGFFPYGSYSEVEHIDPAAMARGEAWPLYSQFLANSPFGDDPVLPPSLAGKFESWTRAQLLRMKSKKFSVLDIFVGEEEPKRDKDDDAEEPAEVKEEPGARLPEGTQLTVMENIGDLLGVYRYEALDLLIEEALKRGEMEPTGHVIDERPIYSFRAPGEGEGEAKVRYAYAMPTGEFLTAERLRNLALMVEAGMGRDMNILDDEDFVRIIAMLPDLGQKWSAVSIATEMRMMAERMRRSGEDEEKVTRWEDYAERAARLRVDTTLIGEQITEREYEVYADEDYAKELFEKGQTQEMHMGSLPDDVVKHEENLRAARKKELFDNMIVTTIVYDRKLLESAKASNDAMQELIGNEGGTGKPTIVIIDQEKTDKK